MKMIKLYSLLSLSLFCISTTSFSAQTVNAPTTEQNDDLVVFEYSDITLSDPSIYSNEAFSISLTVKNNGGKEAKHEVRLLLQDKTAPKGQRKQGSKYLALRAGQSETVTFTFQASDLMEAQESMPDFFVFLLGEYEIEVGYEK